MSLQRDDFMLTEEELQKLNALIRKTVNEIYEAAPEEDPLDGMSVIFTFTPGLGRSIEIDIAGRLIDID